MAGETIRTEAVCLDIRPWSRTSHVVSWLTPDGKVTTVVKGAVRPKSAFLGQYDLNYTCDILYYARTCGEAHALRDCLPLKTREPLRGDYRKLALAGYFRHLASELAPAGPDCAAWYGRLASALDALPSVRRKDLVSVLVRFELDVLRLAGLSPDFSGYDRKAEWSPFSLETASFSSVEGRSIRISRDVAEYLSSPACSPRNDGTPLDAARVIGVFYQFHMGISAVVRRTVLGLISQNKEG